MTAAGSAGSIEEALIAADLAGPIAVALTPAASAGLTAADLEADLRGLADRQASEAGRLRDLIPADSVEAVIQTGDVTTEGAMTAAVVLIAGVPTAAHRAMIPVGAAVRAASRDGLRRSVFE